ncbi:MAG: response regulator [Flammeovirgaceae bacterium]
MSKLSTILYVDDEEHNLLSFTANFRRHYQILTAKSGEEGLNLLEKHEVEVVITDQRMPRMSGVEFAEAVAKRKPDVVRIIMTGFSDVQAIIEAINKGGVYRYISKPWDKEELKISIDNAIETYRLRKENKLLLQSLKEINTVLESKINERTQEILQKNKELEEANNEKNHLIGIVAHDLKSPLNQIKGFMTLLYMTAQNLSQEEMSYIQMSLDTIEGMQDMIRQILDWNAIESKKANIILEKVDLNSLLKEAVARFEMDLSEKNLRIHLPNESRPFYAMLDKSYVQQILDNLLSNAIKFSPIGKNIYLSIEESTKNSARISIRDEGQGLTEEDKTKLFGKFQRLSAKPTAGEHSTGLGLSIVKKFVEELGGKVWCESEFGNGATFFVEFNVIS